jgi:predicted transcriptional regulator
MVTLTLKPELVQRLKAWIAAQRLPPAQNAVVELAIEEFLDRNEAADKKTKEDADAD